MDYLCYAVWTVAMARQRAVLVVLDGLDPSYLEAAATPNLAFLAAHGTFKLVQAVLPSVTNVNHAAVVTGAFPSETGVVSNYRFDPMTRTGTYIETADALCSSTVFDRLARSGGYSILVTSKMKLLQFLGRNASLAVSSEVPPGDLVHRLGPPPSIYSAEIDEWTLRATQFLLKREQPDLVYCTTTDYSFQRWPPGSRAVESYPRRLDECIGELIASAADYRVVITADHGMRAKTKAIDPTRALAHQGIETSFIPPIMDRYVVHHQNMGGAGYVIVHNGSRQRAQQCLAALPGVEAVYERDEASSLFHLPSREIGDLFLLADEDSVFAPAGVLSDTMQPLTLRSHGSRQEATVPMWGYGIDVSSAQWNLDAIHLLGL